MNTMQKVLLSFIVMLLLTCSRPSDKRTLPNNGGSNLHLATMSVASVSHPVKAVYAPASNISVEEFADFTNVRHNLRLDSIANIAIRTREVNDLLAGGDYGEARVMAQTAVIAAPNDDERSQALRLVIFAWLFPYMNASSVDTNQLDVKQSWAGATSALDELVTIAERSPEEIMLRELGQGAELLAVAHITIYGNLDGAFSCIRMYESAMNKANATGSRLERDWLGNIYYEISRHVLNCQKVETLRCKRDNVKRMRSYVESVSDDSVWPKIVGKNITVSDDYKGTLKKGLTLCEQMNPE